MRIGFIGAGKTGFSLGKYFAECGGNVTGYYSLHESSARAAAEFTGTRYFAAPEELLKESDALFLTVPDGAIRSVYGELTRFDITGMQLCHCSGAMTAAEAFPDVRRRGAFGYSIHPLFPLSSKLESFGELAGAFFCVEGNGEYLDNWREFLESMELRVQVIDGAKKARYHAACAVSSNLVCALVEESVELLLDCGFTRETAMDALAPLIRQNTANILRRGPITVLTGAVERGDVGTVQKHLDCFPSAKERELYRAVSEKLVEVAKAKNPHIDYTELEKLLTGGRSQ
ncbi:MAG: DUF2520 domain-containing protein [Ruminococcus sp.]|nr:DUF2520 domain-containing protein [Ruminococcus sp.]